ncbi:gag-pol polyprotein [Tanacetum coccineum]|uniref:Gag-pol polyprotein n=1 Tax=Tanacetum coccineum TaxID=301880 RepID=A0ABQ4YPZ9_9ASTR
MADEQPCGRGRRRGGRVRGQPRRGGDGGVGEDERQPHRRDLEIATQGRRIRELERLLAAARLDVHRDINHETDHFSNSDIGEDGGSDLSLSNGEEEINPCGANFHRRDRGKPHPDEFIDWLHTVERVFDIKNLSDEQKVKLVAIKLKKNASIWWEHIIRQRAREGKTKITSWTKMKNKLMAKFLPVHYRQEAFIDYHSFRQVARYLASLRPEIADVVHLQQYWSYNDVCRLSLKVEGQLKKKTSSSRFTSRVMGNEMGKRVVGSNQTRNPYTSATPNSGTSQNQNSNPSSSRGGATTSKRCYKCQGLGHFAADCPNRQIVTILEEDFGPVFDECGDEVEENVVDQEEITYADSGEALVVRRTLSTVVANEDESWLRHNIFHTKCTCKGKVCNVIIDGGSCENVISATMVSKLSLTTEEHPHPYKLSWFKKGNEVRVSQRCLVNFSIGKKYSDEVWCDVVPMDACHMLLGRPWQFDRKTMHDGYKNTYSFKKDGETIILGPSDIRKESKNQLLSQAEFLAEAQDATNVYALVVVESNECRFDVPHEVKAILDDFADVVPDELPPGLPPMRDIQHCIDFVPGAVIPHKVAYRMNPKEHEELQRQVRELLEKGYIRESMSPCAVLGIRMDPTKVDAILSWPTPTNVHETRSFHGLTSFYRRFIRNFSTLISPITECVKGSTFHWTREAHEAFELLKKKVTEAPVLILPDFDDVFEVHCDASGVGIGGTLNKVVDALSRRQALLSVMQVETVGFEIFKELFDENPRQWDLVLSQAEFAYNRSHNRTTGNTPFEVVSGVNPITPLDLTPLPTTTHFSSSGEAQAQQRVVFKEGDLVWIRLGKERFPAGRFGKLQPRADGPFRVLKRINDNAYKIDLPGTYNVSATFNVADLSPYVTDSEDDEDEENHDVEQDSRANLFQAGEYGAQ